MLLLLRRPLPIEPRRCIGMLMSQAAGSDSAGILYHTMLCDDLTREQRQAGGVQAEACVIRRQQRL